MERPASGFGGGPRLRAPGRRPERATWFVALVAGLAGGLMAAALLLAGHALRPAPNAIRSAAPRPEVAVSPAVRVYERAAPAVVLVAGRGERVTPLLGRQPATGFGTGVIFDPRGYIVTNDHVVAGALQLRVTLHDGRTLPARLVGGDPSTDLAVLRIEAGRPLPAATFALGPVRPGELAVAIGNPLGPRLQQSVTVGVVSAVRPMLYGLLNAEPRVTRMIQTDVAINPGNSGGPLLNAAGEVIGITTVKVPLVEPGVAAAGLGFAIPAGTVRRVVDDLVRYGFVKRAWLGVQLMASPAEALPAEAQLIAVAAVVPGGPAARAGLRPGDQIVAWNGRAMRNYFGLIEAIDGAVPGRPVQLTVRRGSGTASVTVVPGTVPRGGAAGSREAGSG